MRVEVALKKTIVVSEYFDVTEEQMEDLKKGKNPFHEELEDLMYDDGVAKLEDSLKYEYCVKDDGNEIIGWRENAGWEEGKEETLEEILADVDTIEDDKEFMLAELEAVRDYCVRKRFDMAEDEMQVVLSRGLDEDFEDWKRNYEHYGAV